MSDSQQARSKSETLGIYVQVPFCQAKCTYCNFHTGVFSRSLYSPYVDAMCREIRTSRALQDRAADTVYIGGGTPSLLAPLDLARLLATIREAYQDAWGEVTLEADPETITRENAAQWRVAGINRISMGVQSFNNEELQAAGRMHRRDDIFRAFAAMREAGFDNISMDLIAGLPFQTRQTWKSSVGELLAIRPEHISVYLLEIDEGSRLGREILSGGNKYASRNVVSDDEMADFYEFACEALKDAGYEHYEISNWSLPGRASRHNLKYWRREPYIGFGAGAHSFDGAKRWSNNHDPAAYAATISRDGSVREQEEAVTVEAALNEEFFLGLRQLDGVDLARIEREYGPRGSGVSLRVEKLVGDGLLQRSGDYVRLNPAKLAISNEAFVELLS